MRNDNHQRRCCSQCVQFDSNHFFLTVKRDSSLVILICHADMVIGMERYRSGIIRCFNFNGDMVTVMPRL